MVKMTRTIEAKAPEKKRKRGRPKGSTNSGNKKKKAQKSLARKKTGKQDHVKTTIEQVQLALKKCDGRPRDAAQLLGITEDAIYKRLHNNPTLREYWNELRIRRVLKAEASLDNLIDNREPSAIYFTLKTLGKNLGYIEKHQTEISGTGEGGRIEFVWKDETGEAPENDQSND